MNGCNLQPADDQRQQQDRRRQQDENQKAATETEQQPGPAKLSLNPPLKEGKSYQQQGQREGEQQGEEQQRERGGCGPYQLFRRQLRLLEAGLAGEVGRDPDEQQSAAEGQQQQ